MRDKLDQISGRVYRGVRLRHIKIHAAECAECETGEGKVDRIEREIELEGPLRAEQHALLRELPDRCLMHRTLEREIVAQTLLCE